MTRPDDWRDAITDYEAAIDAFAVAIAHTDAARWHAWRANGGWSPAALALHVCLSYEVGTRAARGGAGMLLRASPAASWFARRIVLPLMLTARRFPRGARAPREVRPDEVETLQIDQPAMIARLRRAGAEAAEALQHATIATPTLRITHAYFGALSPYDTLRLLSAHTRHHCDGMRAH